MQEQFRRVNRSLGKNPKLGPFSAKQIIPVVACLLSTATITNLFHLSWIQSTFLLAWLLGISWVLFGENPWRYVAKYVRAPRLVRGGTRYVPLLTKKSNAPVRR